MCAFTMRPRSSLGDLFVNRKWWGWGLLIALRIEIHWKAELNLA